MEIKKIIRRKEYKYTLIAIMFICLMDSITKCRSFSNQLMSNIYPAYAVNIIAGSYNTNFSTVFRMFIPVLATYIASDSYLQDMNNGVNNMLFTRTKRTKYIWTKMFAILLVVVFTIYTCLLLDFVFAIVAFPLYGNNLSGIQLLWGIQPDDVYTGNIIGEELLRYNPYLNLLLFSFLFSIWCGICAITSYAISFFIRNRYVILFSSFLIYRLIPSPLNNMFTLNPEMSLSKYIIIWVMALLSVIIMLIIAKKKEEING